MELVSKDAIPKEKSKSSQQPSTKLENSLFWGGRLHSNPVKNVNGWKFHLRLESNIKGRYHFLNSTGNEISIQRRDT